MNQCKNDDDCCKSCVKMVSALILKENKQLHNEAINLKEENKDLKEEIKGLKDGNKTMMDNISMASYWLNRGKK